MRRLGLRLRELREAKGLTQEQVAEKATVDAKHVQAVEAGGVNVTLATLLALARALGVSVSELVAGVEGRPRAKRPSSKAIAAK